MTLASVGGSGEDGFLLVWKNIGLTIGCLFVRVFKSFVPNRQLGLKTVYSMSRDCLG